MAMGRGGQVAQKPQPAPRPPCPTLLLHRGRGVPRLPEPPPLLVRQHKDNVAYLRELVERLNKMYV